MTIRSSNQKKSMSFTIYWDPQDETYATIEGGPMNAEIFEALEKMMEVVGKRFKKELQK